MNQAFKHLDQAYMEAEPWLALCGFSPSLDPLRSDPRFLELLKKLDFKDYENEQLN